MISIELANGEHQTFSDMDTVNAYYSDDEDDGHCATIAIALQPGEFLVTEGDWESGFNQLTEISSVHKFTPYQGNLS